MALSSDLLEAVAMDTNEEVRRRRLDQLCSSNGGVRAVAEKAGMNWQGLDQILKKVLLPPKADGTRSVRNLGEDTARKLEAVYNLGEGWFDWPFDNVDFKQWAGLNTLQRLYVQGQLAVALRDAAKIKVSPDLLQQAVTDKRVEESFGVIPPQEVKAAMERAAGRERSSVAVPWGDLFDRDDETGD